MKHWYARFFAKKIRYENLTEVRIGKRSTMLPVGDVYSLTLQNGAWVASHNRTEGTQDHIRETVVDDAFVRAIKAVLTENNVHQWDGFHKTNARVTDGNQFTFDMKFSDGTGIRASGYAAYPRQFQVVLNVFKACYDALPDIYS